MPEETVIRSHVHATGQIVGPVPVGVEGQPEEIQHGVGVHDARRPDDDRGRGIVDAVSRGRVSPSGRTRCRRV